MTNTCILLIKDDADLRAELKRHIEELGYAVSGTFQSASEMAPIISVSRPGLLLVDTRLAPELSDTGAAADLEERLGAAVLWVASEPDDGFLSSNRISELDYVVRPFTRRQLQTALGATAARRTTTNHPRTSRNSQLKAGDRKRAELSRQQLEALYDASPDMIFLHDGSGRIVDVNRNVSEFYGYSKAELLNKPVEELSGHGYTQAMAEAQLQRARDGEDVDFEWMAKRRDGSEHPLEIRLRRLAAGAAPNSESVVAVARDLTRQKATEDTLRQERDFSNTILNTIGAVVVVLDSEGRIVQFNHAAEQVTGFRESELIGKHIWDHLIPEEQIASVTGVFRQLAGGNFPTQHRNYWLTRGGERRLLDWSNTVLCNDNGSVEFVIATGIDITEQERTQQALSSIEEQWHHAMEFFDYPIYLVDLDDKVLRANKAFYELIHRGPDTVLGQSIVKLMHPDGETMPCPVCLARKERKDAYITLEKDHPDNHFGKPVEAMLRVIRKDNGQPMAILMGLRDLTRQREIEEELRGHRDHLEELVERRTRQMEATNKELEAFAYSISHDLRGPLRAINGFSEILTEDYAQTLDDDAKGHLGRIRNASLRMEQLIDDLLELSRLSQRQLQRETVDLSRMVHAINEDLRQSHPDRTVQLSVHDNMMISADPKLLQIMMENLIGNAWKFTARETVAHICIGSDLEHGKRCFYICDNGVGFDMAYADKLFGAFQRLHHQNEFAGTGIGLATVQRIVNRHAGRIWADSMQGRGTCFYFQLGSELRTRP